MAPQEQLLSDLEAFLAWNPTGAGHDAAQRAFQALKKELATKDSAESQTLMIALPNGYVVTPAEPSDEMYEVGYNALREIHAGPFGGSPSWGHAGKVFRAMLAVAQKEPMSGFTLVPVHAAPTVQAAVAKEA